MLPWYTVKDEVYLFNSISSNFSSFPTCVLFCFKIQFKKQIVFGHGEEACKTKLHSLKYIYFSILEQTIFEFELMFLFVESLFRALQIITVK